MTYSAKAQRYKKLETCDTMLELMEALNIFSISKIDDNKYAIGEECDQFYWATITKEQLLALSNELKELANVN